ncbi:MAG: hypothetical protein QW625_02985 [Candidatus Nanoarchaeia archaeon]
MKENAKQIICGLATFLTSSLPLKFSALDLEIGFKYSQKQTKPYFALSETYQEKKLVLTGEVEKVKESPLALKLTGIYSLNKNYFVSSLIQIGVNSSFEPLYYITFVGLGKGIGKGSIVVGPGMLTTAENISYNGSVLGSYELGEKVKLSGFFTVPVKSSNKTIVQGGIIYKIYKLKK